MADKFLDRVAGREQQKSPATVSAGAGDAGRIPALDAGGKLDVSMIPGVEVRSMAAFEDLAAGAIVNVFLSGGVAKMRNADATAAGKEATGYVLTAILTGATGNYYEGGVDSSLSGLTIGWRYYLSKTTPGAVLAVPLSTTGGVTGNVDQFLGVALSATELQFDPEEGTILA